MFKKFAAVGAACLVALSAAAASDASAAVISEGTIDNVHFAATGSSIKDPGTYDLTFFTTAEIPSPSLNIDILDKWRIYFSDGSGSGCDHCGFASITAFTPYEDGFRARFTIPEPTTAFFDGSVLDYIRTDNYFAVINVQAKVGADEIGAPYRLSYAAAPEPGTWALMISGFAICGLGLRRNRAARAA